MSGPRFDSRFASIDIGSHTTRMMVAECRGAELTPVRIERRVTRLARDFRKTGSISREAQERTIGALIEYRAILDGLSVRRISCGATGVVREAENSPDVLHGIAQKTGVRPEVLSGEREAFLSAKGILSVLPAREGDFLAFDVGGGSTEFFLADFRGGELSWNASLPIGAATLTETYLAADPPGPGPAGKAALAARREILEAKSRMRAALPRPDGPLYRETTRLAGTAGTVTTLAAMYLEMVPYAPHRVNGLILTGDWLSQTIERLAAMPLSRRREIPGLEPGREDIILGGAIIVSEILAAFGLARFEAADAGLLEGLLLELVEKESGLPPGLTTALTWRPQKG